MEWDKLGWKQGGEGMTGQDRRVEKESEDRKREVRTLSPYLSDAPRTPRQHQKI